MKKNIHINTTFIKLGSLLKLADIGGSGGMTKMIIQDGLVTVNDNFCDHRGKKIYPGDTVQVELDSIPIIIKVK